MNRVTQVLATTNEISLKGGNRKWFERTLTENVRRSLADLPVAAVTRPAWRVLISFSEPVDFAEAARRLHTVFGLGGIMAMPAEMPRAMIPALNMQVVAGSILLAVLAGVLFGLAPVLMTALTSGIGLVPLALAAGEPGKEILYPVATVIIGGLISSTLLEFLVRPALFWKFGLRAGQRVVGQSQQEIPLVEQ